MNGRRALALCVTILAAVGGASQAQALCLYRGEFHGRSTITGEFRESSLVIKGTVIETHDIPPVDVDHSELDSYAVARIRVDEVFKGQAGQEVFLISERNSGGFYVDAGVQYLLFLDPPVRADWSKGYEPAEVAKVQSLPRPRFINYNCGQSAPWVEVSAAKRKALDFETRRQKVLRSR
ncbi:hypothetical protein [Caulobacter sp. NIBR1757]|uniref:hypothetical protein n=1 Tax=Caulobacter sp. NIBR1757 TaxID=3016000 RepID=UPI0022F0B9FF|nr:hypothetical protein [Caulobacter sp. NIBR1757]WGM37364.1 hypothetical protein AMEJIAPC_00262 [Caulobacter sp. NIBR1757]